MIRRILFCVAAVALLLSATADAANRYDPRLRFRTISTERFDIHYHQGEAELARRVAGLAETIARELEPRLGRPRARVHVILVDQTDIANGWATPVPYNLIEIVAASPRAESTIGNTSDWLRLVLTHEYTHVLHLERSRGFFGTVGRVFGRNPFFYPNLFLPPWQVEGIATYAESAVTHEGRVHAGDFRMQMTRAASAGKFPGLDQASNALVQWPGGHTPYLYGGYFHQYLADTYGEASLAKLADAQAARLPFLGSRAFQNVFGKSLGTLWSEFESATASRSSAVDAQVRRLTHHGFTVKDAWFRANGDLFYSVSDPHGFPALMQWTPSGSVRLTTRAGGEQITGSVGGRLLLFDQVEYVRSVALQSDLYVYDFRHGDVSRLTRGARAGDPDLSPDGTTIVCTVQTPDGRALATMPLPQSGGMATPRVLMAEAGSDYASPRWAPDGRLIVAERRPVGGPWEIVLVDPARASVQQVVTSTPQSRNASPVWSRDGGTIFFASDRGGGPFHVYAADLGARTLRRLEGVASAQSPALSPDGTTLVFVGYTPAGYDLFSLPLAAARWHDVTNEPTIPGSPLPPPSSAPAGEPGSPYSPLRTLLPRFWTPIVEEDGDDTAIGAETSGADALGRHAYFASAAWSTRARPDWSLAYAYDRWRPTFFGDVSDDVEPFRSGQLRVRDVNAGALIAFKRVRRTQSLIGAFHAAREQLDCPRCETPAHAEATRRALRASWTYDSSRTYGFSISDEEGFTATAASEWTRRAFGADGNATTVVGELRRYVRARPRHAALAGRIAGAASWGDERVRRAFAAGGSGAALGFLDFSFDAIALVRGFDAGDVSGRRAVVVNADYRIPLAWIERGVGTWPIFLRSLHGAVFADAGAAWDDRRTRHDRRASVGAELSADLVAGYWLPLTAAVGVAVRHDPTGRKGGPTFFARAGRAF